jgi:hypothetical protein
MSIFNCLISNMNRSNPILRLGARSIGDDRACSWSWFSSVQAATHKEHGDRPRKAQNSGGSVSFWFAISSPLIGILLALLALVIFQP